MPKECVASLRLLHGREILVRHGCQAALLLLVGLIAPSFARSSGQSAASSIPIQLQVKWISDSHYGKLGGARIQLSATYQFTTPNKFKWVGGSLDMAEGSWEGRKATFQYVSPAAQAGGGASGAVSGLEDDAGELDTLDNGDSQIEIAVQPEMQGVSGPFDEALGCYGSADHSLMRVIPLSQPDLAQLRNGSIRKQAKDSQSTPGCAESFSVEITMPTIELKYDKTDRNVEVVKYPGGKTIGAKEAMNPNLYLQMGETWKEFGDFAGQVTIGGVDQIAFGLSNANSPDGCSPAFVTSQFGIRRKVRSWSLDNEGNVKAPTPAWQPDNSCPVQDWLDSPEAGSLGQGAPNTWKYEGTLDEFLVDVRDRPECGCIYIAFAIQIRPNEYRVKYIPPTAIDRDEWNRRLSASDPPDAPKFSDADPWIRLEKRNGNWVAAITPANESKTRDAVTRKPL